MVAQISGWEQDASLFSETNFSGRADVFDALDFILTDPAVIPALSARAERLKAALEKTDRQLFQKLRTEIRQKQLRGSAFTDLVSRYLDIPGPNEAAGYDDLDSFVNGLIFGQTVPEPLLPLHPDMVFYQKTPARIVFEMGEFIHRGGLKNFHDVGSGLGQVAILVHLLTGVSCEGIEYEPAYCRYAEACAAGLNLGDIRLLNENAASANYSKADVIFLYTPFHGATLQQVLRLLQAESRKRMLRIFSYGPCSKKFSDEPWLKLEKGNAQNLSCLCRFRSR